MSTPTHASESSRDASCAPPGEHARPDPAPSDKDALVRELRVRVGLLQTELEHLRREHAALKASLAHDIAALSRRYLEASKPAAVRNVDGVIFGGWDRHDAPPGEEPGADELGRNSRTA